jgi:hypothetical protein
MRSIDRNRWKYAMCVNKNESAVPTGKNVAFIDLHDARLRALSLQSDGAGSITFDHLSVFVEVSKDKYDVWSYRAYLLLQGVKRLSLDRGLDFSEYVSDGRLIDTHGRQINPASMLDWTPAAEVELTLSSGGKLSLLVSRARFDLTEAVNKMEEWIGPLVAVHVPEVSS